MDNGVSGNIGFIFPDILATYFKTPIKRCLDYTKAKKFLNRIDTVEMKSIFRSQIPVGIPVFVGLERPMIQPKGRWRPTVSAIRADEATKIVLEELNLPYEYIDSGQWQRVLLPTGCVGPELKKASSEVGKRLFPHLAKYFKKDADGILIAEYLRRRDLNPKTL